jgi:hypothetical protein
LGPDAGNIDAITILWPSRAVQQLANVSPNQVLNVVENATALPGDYNLDGLVDAADYVVWRKTDGDNPAGYALWRANFADTLSGTGGRLADTSVPEPSSVVFLAVGVMFSATASRIARAGANPVIW